MARTYLQNLSACKVELYLHSPLWAVQNIESLSACTVQLYHNSPYGLYIPYSPSVIYSTANLLLPLWAVRVLQNISACTVQLNLYYPYEPYGL